MSCFREYIAHVCVQCGRNFCSSVKDIFKTAFVGQIEVCDEHFSNRIATFRSLPKDDDDDVKDNVNMIKKGLSHLI